ALGDLGDFYRELRSNLHSPAWAQLAARRHHRLPPAITARHGPEEENFRAGAARTRPEQSCFHHACRVDDEDVAGRNEVDEIAEVTMLDRFVVASHHHESTCRPIRERLLRDELRRQLESVVGSPVPKHKKKYSAALFASSAVKENRFSPRRARRARTS